MMDAEKARHLLAHALPPDARQERFKRSFDKRAHSALQNCGCNDARIERLQRILPAIAYYHEAGPRLADVREQLADVAARTHAAASSLRALLDVPKHEEASDEARGWLLQALAERHPERCERDPQRVSFHQRHDPREDEARRLLAAIDDVATAAQHAGKRMSKAPQTRAVAHGYPVELIDAALSVDGLTVPVSATKGSMFLRIAGVCYRAALGSNATPLRAIRSYLAAQRQA